MRLLLVSSSVVHGTGYLEHCAAEITDLLAGVGEVTFVPYALHDHEAYAAKARTAFAGMGFGLTSLHEHDDPSAVVAAAEALFVGGGNTFRLLKAIHDHGLVAPLRTRVRAGIPYVGTSAGSNVACAGIHTTNDMPIVYPPTFEGLGFTRFNINPHYLDPDPASTHQGETRETRIREFHEEHDRPVVGLREGAMLRIEASRIELRGSKGARLFQRGSTPLDVAPGEPLPEWIRV